MTEPRTLMQMAGAPRSLPVLADTTLVLIDAQNEYRSGALPLDGIDPAIGKARRLLDAARAAGARVIHVAHKGAPGGLFDRTAETGRIVDELAPDAGEAVVEKGLPNSFAGTDLQALVAEAGRPTLLLVGFMTHMCVSSTARAALDLGHRVAIAGDATATRPLPDPMGGAAIDAATLQHAALAALADRFATVFATEEIA